MGKMINWSMKDTNGCVQRGQMFLSQLPKILLSFENSAAETLREPEPTTYFMRLKFTIQQTN